VLERAHSKRRWTQKVSWTHKLFKHLLTKSVVETQGQAWLWLFLTPIFHNRTKHGSETVSSLFRSPGVALGKSAQRVLDPRAVEVKFQLSEGNRDWCFLWCYFLGTSGGTPMRLDANHRNSISESWSVQRPWKCWWGWSLSADTPTTQRSGSWRISVGSNLRAFCPIAECKWWTQGVLDTNNLFY